MGYAQQNISLIKIQTTKYRINELTDFMDAYASNYLTHGASETLKKLYCSKFFKQQDLFVHRNKQKYSQNVQF